MEMASYDLGYVYNGLHDKYCEEIGIKYYQYKSPSAEKIHQGYIIPSPPRDKSDYPEGYGEREGGVIDSSGEYVPISKRRLLKYDFNYARLNGTEDVTYVDEAVCYLGPIAGYWGHIITEISSWLWYAISNPGLKWAYFDYTDPEVTLIRKPLMEFLKFFGIDEEDLIAITVPTQFKAVVVPEVSALPGVYYTREYVKTFDFVRDKVTSEYVKCNNRFSKVYLTKTQFKDAKDNQIGEETIKNIFADNDYVVIAPEQLSVNEQIIIYANAEEIVAPEGTLPHNILFCQDYVKLTIINRCDRINKYQIMINELRSARVTYIDCWSMIMPIYPTGPYVFWITENFVKYAEDNKLHINVKCKGYVDIYIKMLWYILRYLDLYDGAGDWSKIDKIWKQNNSEKYLMSRLEMDCLASDDAKQFSKDLQRLLKDIVE